MRDRESGEKIAKIVIQPAGNRVKVMVDAGPSVRIIREELETPRIFEPMKQVQEQIEERGQQC